MKSFAELSETPGLRIEITSKDGFRGTVSTHKWAGSVVCSIGAGWEHVSVAPFKRYIVPTWEDMCKIKGMFWRDDEAVIQIHPPAAEYVNMVPNCLHLWRCTYKDMVLPPSILVGIKKGQSSIEIYREIKAAYEMAGEKYV